MMIVINLHLGASKDNRIVFKIKIQKKKDIGIMR